MPTRIDIELTSAGADGSWTWRAAGARAPRGVLDGSILPEGASVGDLVKAETEHDVDGIRVLSIVTGKPKAERAGMLELLPAGDFEPVIQQRAQRERGERGEGARGKPRRDRDDKRDRGDRGDRRDRAGGAGGDGGARRERTADSRPRRDGDGGDRRQRPHFTPPPELPQRPKPKRLRPGKQHRNEVLDSIPEEQRPVAELTLQGIAAVRQRVRDDNARLVADGKPAMPEATVLKMAEELLPRLRVADWLDRADAAKRQLEHLDLRDLRSVVAASDDPAVARDESTRNLANELKASLVTKQEEELNLWFADVEANVDIGRVVRALRLSAMPPKAGVPFPAALGAKLAEATTAALSADDPAERWVAVLEAAAFSPVRSLVTPAAAPSQVTPELTATATRLGPLLPQVAALLGIEVAPNAPAPKPLRPTARRDQPAAAGRRPARPPAETKPSGKPPRPPRPEPAGAERVTPAATEPVEAAVAEPGETPDTDAAEAPEATQTPELAEAAVAEPTVTPDPDAADVEPTDTTTSDIVEAGVAEPAETPDTDAAEAPEATQTPAAAEAADAEATVTPDADAAEAPEATQTPEVAEAAVAEATDTPDTDAADVEPTDTTTSDIVEAGVAEPAETPDADAAEAPEATQTPEVAEAAVAEATDTPDTDAADVEPTDTTTGDIVEAGVAQPAETPDADASGAPEPSQAHEVAEAVDTADADAAEAPEGPQRPEVAETGVETDGGAEQGEAAG